MTTPSPTPNDLFDAIDRFGADVAAWLDRELAGRVNRAALADRDIRAWLDGARDLDAAIARARDAVDDELAASGAVARVAANVIAASRPGRRQRHWWIAVAAALLVAAGLGSVFELRVIAPAIDGPVDVVVLDPLVFGATEADLATGDQQ